jgi:hypothetical protein
MGARQHHVVLGLLDCRSGHVAECDVAYQRSDQDRLIYVYSRDGSKVAEAASQVDFEDALCDLRRSLEEDDLLLLCNRFRVDAFVSSMSRQMTDGLGCYIVEPQWAVDPSLLVDALAPAPRERVAAESEANEFISNWIESFND